MTKQPPADLHHLVLETGVAAARQAGELIAAAAGALDPGDVRLKGKNDLVTAVDERSQKAIVDAILDRFPDHGILAEEGLDTRTGDGSPPEHLWIIDPIDGTTNFTRGIPPYAVSIGYAHRGRLTVGVVLDVAHDELFTAVEGEGLFLNGVRTGVTGTEMLADAVITTGFPYRALDHVDVYLSVLKEFMSGSRAVRRPGSASVDLAWVACGRFDGFFETGLKPWDVAAGIVLVREGGGRITSYAGNPDAAFDHQIVASNGRIHEEMLALLDPMKHITD